MTQPSVYKQEGWFSRFFSSEPLGWEVLWYIAWQGNSVTVPWESREFSLSEEAQVLMTSCCPFTRHCLAAFWFLGTRVHGDGLLRTQETLRGWIPIEKPACYFHPHWVFWGRHLLRWQRQTVWSWICSSFFLGLGLPSRQRTQHMELWVIFTTSCIMKSLWPLESLGQKF